MTSRCSVTTRSIGGPVSRCSDRVSAKRRGFKAGTAVIEERVPRRPPTVRADRDQIVQVLTNLIQNALDAVRDLEDGRITITMDPLDADHAAITVSDNGPGIAPEIASRLFEPYATTKASGTGLGLAIARRIAQLHDGRLDLIESRPGRTVFAVRLPSSESVSIGGHAVTAPATR